MDLLGEYLDWFENQRRAAASTFRIYENVLGRFFADVVVEREPDDLEVEELEQWVQRKRTGGRAGFKMIEPSAATVSRDGNILRSFYKWAHARGRIERNPADLLVLPPVLNEHPKPVPEADWLAWMTAPLDLELRAILLLGGVGGLRRSEMISLCSANVSGDQLVNVRRKGNSVDTVPIGLTAGILQRKLPGLLVDQAEVIETLGKLTASTEPSTLLLASLEGWEECWRADGVNRALSTAARRHKLRGFTPHQLRHSCATNLLRAGVPLAMVSRYLNHRSISTTMRYVRAEQSELREWDQNDS